MRNIFPALKRTLRFTWDKNWPDLRATATGGMPRFVFAQEPRELKDSVPAFCYHMAHQEQLEADLEFLTRNGYTTITADALLDHLEGRQMAPKRAVVLTFDDGARSLYEVAFPLLKRFRMVAVAFIATAFHQEESDDRFAEVKENPFRPISWQEIDEMHRSGFVDFQCHTHSHRYLPRWPEAADLEGCDPIVANQLRDQLQTVQEDLAMAKRILEQRLGKPVRHLAFPKFTGTQDAVRIGYEYGYEGFWWGTLPFRSGNRPGESSAYIIRIHSRYLLRLPGKDRKSLVEVLKDRYSGSCQRLVSAFGREMAP